MTSSRIRLMLMDDHEVVRERLVLEGVGHMPSGTVRDAIGVAARKRADVVVMDVRLTQHVRREEPLELIRVSAPGSK